MEREVERERTERERERERERGRWVYSSPGERNGRPVSGEREKNER